MSKKIDFIRRIETGFETQCKSLGITFDSFERRSAFHGVWEGAFLDADGDQIGPELYLEFAMDQDMRTRSLPDVHSWFDGCREEDQWFFDFTDSEVIDEYIDWVMTSVAGDIAVADPSIR